MRIAFRELRREPGRFLFVGVAMTVLAALLLLLGGLLDGLFLGSTGAIRAQSAEVFVYSSDAQESFLRSRITPELAEEVAAVPGVTATGGLGVTLDAGRTDGGDELLDVAVFGYDLTTDALPEPPGPGEAWADRTLADDGVAVGDVVRIGAAEVPLTVVGFVDDTSYLLQSSLWVDLGTWHEVQATSRPDAALDDGTVQVLLVEGDRPAAELATAIEEALGGEVEALTRDEAVLSLPGTQEQNATFSALIGTTFVVVGLISGLFFVLLAVERTGLYAAMKALGVSTGGLVLWSLAQAVIVAASAFLAGGVGAVALDATVLAGLPLLLEPSRAISTVLILLLTASVGSLIPLRRIARIDPAEAIS